MGDLKTDFELVKNLRGDKNELPGTFNNYDRVYRDDRDSYPGFY